MKVAFKKWIIGESNRELAKSLAEEFDIDPFTALVASVRGVTDSSELEFMLSEEPLLCDPDELIDIDIAADFINTAISENKSIAVYGDYDCDGVVSTVIMYDYLSSRGANVSYYIPDRADEGYGMNRSAVDKLKAQGTQVIITVDNGIACKEEIAYAKSLGIETVVTDHHLPPEELPDAVAVVDPHRKDCPSTFKEVCGAMVAFKVICAIDDKEPEQLLYKYADLLSIATIGDVMPLVNENRGVVKAGINSIKNKARVGVGAIISVGGFDRTTINSGRISFGIVPRINAAGRVGDATRAVKLLLCTNMLEAIGIANEIDNDNALRQSLERKVTAEACEIIEKNGYQHNRVIVVSGKDWHCGILGIAASKITEKYGKPSFVLSESDGVCHGSGRSLKGFHLYDALSASSHSLIKFGGHELAAGVSVAAGSVDMFRKSINEYANTLAFTPPSINIDLKLNPAGLSVDMAFAIKALEPFGAGNPTPVFAFMGVTLDKITPIGNGKHLRLLFSKNGNAFQALLFGVTPEQFCFEQGDVLDLAVNLEPNLYHDEYTLSVQIKAIRLSGIDEDRLFREIENYDNLLSGNDGDAKAALPDRSEVGILYKTILSGPVKLDRLKYINFNNSGYAKTMIALKTLLELGLICEKNGVLYAVSGANKTELSNSETYNFLLKKVN